RELRLQLQKRLVDAAQFLRAEVAVIDGSLRLAVADDGQRPDRLQEVGVADDAAVQLRRAGRVEEAAQLRQSQLAAATPAQRTQHQLQGVVQVGVRRAAGLLRDPPQPGRRVE